MKFFFALRVIRRVGRAILRPARRVRNAVQETATYLRSSGKTFRLSDVRKAQEFALGASLLSDEALQRLIEFAHRAMDSGDVNPVGSLWHGWGDTFQSELADPLREKDSESLRVVLGRLASSPVTRGISWSGDFPKTHSEMLRQANRMNRLSVRYSQIHPERSRPIPYPAVFGPSAGAAEESGILLPSSFRFSLNAWRIHALVGDSGCVVEIGGGFGAVAFHIRQESSFSGRFHIFDLPLGATISAAFLMTTLGEDEVHLWGESGNASASVHVYPHYAYGDGVGESIDLVFNSHSLTEMSREVADRYLSGLNGLGATYFLHANHEYGTNYTSPSGSAGTHLVIGRDVSPPENWRRVFRLPELLHNDGVVFGDSDYWEELWMSIPSRGSLQRQEGPS